MNQHQANTSVEKPTFGIGQMMLIMAWLGLAFGLIRSTLITRPPTFGGYSAIAASESGEYLAAVHYAGIHLFRKGKYVNSFEVGGRVSSLKYIDEDTLALAINRGVDTGLEYGVHFYSLKQNRITRSITVESEQHTKIRLLDDKFIVYQFDQFDVYDMDAPAESGPSSSCQVPNPSLPFAASNDGRFIAFHEPPSFLADNFDSVDNDVMFIDYDLETGKSINSLPTSNGLAFSPDGSFVITSRNELEKFSWPSAEKQWSVPNDRPSGRVRISPDGKRFAAVTGSDYSDEERYLRVYDSLTGEKLFETELSKEHGVAYTFSPDGQTVWTSADDESGVLLQWDIASSSIVNRVGTSRQIQYVLLYTTLFFLWSMLYSKLFPGQVRIQEKWRVVLAGWLMFLSILIIAINCYVCFGLRDTTSLISGLAMLFPGTLIAVNSSRTVFGYAKNLPEQ